VADIEGVSLDTVKGFFKRHYRPQGAVLGLVGHFDTDKALERLKFWFQDVPGTPRDKPRLIQFDGPREGNRGWMKDPQVDDTNLYVGWRTVPKGHPDEIPLQVAAWVLSGGRGTRLDDKVYYKSNLAVDDGVYAWSSELDGVFLAYATVDGTPLAKMEKIILKEIMRLIKKPPTEDELHRAKRSIRNNVMKNLELPADRVGILVECTRLMGSPDCLQEQLNTLDNVSTDDVIEAVLRWLNPDKRVVLSVVPNDVEVVGGTKVELP
jgi:zinc protease